MDKFLIEGSGLSKTFDGKIPIFKNVNLILENRKALGIAGKNGSGKSTLLKIFAGLIAPTKGKITLSVNDSMIDKDNFNDYYGFVSPYLNLYEEFTAVEQIKIFLDLCGLSGKKERAEELLDELNISNTGGKYISKFSSGMKQRLKFVLAFINDPPILFLDEPFSNLDESGIVSVEKLISKHIEKGGGVIIASNDGREKALCQEIISLDLN